MALEWCGGFVSSLPGIDLIWLPVVLAEIEFKSKWTIHSRDFYSHAPAKCWNYADAQGAASTAQITQIINTYEAMIIT